MFSVFEPVHAGVSSWERAATAIGQNVHIRDWAHVIVFSWNYLNQQLKVRRAEASEVDIAFRVHALCSELILRAIFPNTASLPIVLRSLYAFTALQRGQRVSALGHCLAALIQGVSKEVWPVIALDIGLIFFQYSHFSSHQEIPAASLNLLNCQNLENAYRILDISADKYGDLELIQTQYERLRQPLVAARDRIKLPGLGKQAAERAIHQLDQAYQYLKTELDAENSHG